MSQKQNPKERLKEITDSIETGIKELFESDKYKSYLQTMSRFHKYSFNNTMLISMQKPDATLVAGFNKWRDGFSRHVKKGEKGIKIIAPTPYKIKEQREKLDPQTKAPILDASGKVQTEEVEIQIPMYRVVSVFDVSQTYGEPLPTLASNLTGNVEQFEVFMEAIKRATPVPIELKPMSNTTDGYYHTEEKRIAIREGMSEVQTISATIHEVAHSLLHNKETEKELQAQQDERTPPAKSKDRNTEEVEAESISFAVCSYYGIQTSENSFGYIASWSKGKELAELRASLETINKTSSELISGIDKHFAEIVKERGIDLTAETPVPEQYPEQLAYHVGENYLAIHKVAGGHAYSFFDKDFNLINSGSHDDPEWTIYDIARDLLAEGDVPPFANLDDFTQADYETITEKANYVAQSKVIGTVKYSDVTNEFTLSSPDFEDRDMPLYTNRDGEQFVFGYGAMGNGITVWNYLDETGNDYTTVAHISHTGELTYHVDNLPDTAKNALVEKAEELRKEHDADRNHISEDGSFITVDGYKGTWYAIDSQEIEGKKYFLLEHEEHGDEAACVIVDTDGKLALDDVWNGFDDLNEHFESRNAEEQRIDEPVQHDYPMPDPTVSIDDRNAYGYTGDELLPLSKERAAELWEQDLPVFILYPDNTESMIFDIEEMQDHDGLFGIETADWQAFHNRDKEKDHLPPQEVEAQFLEQTKNAFAIYRLKIGEDLRDYRFEGMDWLMGHGLTVDRANYELVYTAPLVDFNGDKDHTLNKLYEQFNINHTSDFKGHSLSVSDIVALKVDGTVSSHYVDTFGFREVPQFLEPAPPQPDNFLTGERIETPRGSFSLTSMTKEQMEQAGYGYHHSSDNGAYHIMGNGTRAFAIRNEDNPLRTAEMSTEQNYNQIDGIINNQPTVAQLEEDAKSGKPISLMDLLDATRREEKQSVVEQLKAKPPQEQKKEKTVPSKGAEMER